MRRTRKVRALGSDVAGAAWATSFTQMACDTVGAVMLMKVTVRHDGGDHLYAVQASYGALQPAGCSAEWRHGMLEPCCIVDGQARCEPPLPCGTLGG